MNEYTCFVISPIGKEGTDIYQDYKDLLDLIIIPALEVYDMNVMRGDHAITEDKIDTSVIKNIQDADICICDITEPNPNVYYELGRRDETGKPVMLLKRKGSPSSPVDIANRRYFEYDWDSRYGVREAQRSIREFVESLVEQGFEARGKSATLGDIAETLGRLERKLDRLSGGTGSTPSVVPPVIDRNKGGEGGADDTDPPTLFRYALMTKNVPMAENAMVRLQYRMEETTFYDVVVEQVASMGSDIAGKMLMDKAEEFFDNSAVSFKKKTEYLGCLVNYLSRKDKEEEGIDLVLKLCEQLENEADGEDPVNIVQIYNQQNRLYYGIYGNTDNNEWLDRAIEALNKALKIAPDEGFLYFNLSVCYDSYGDETGKREYYEMARDAIDACLERDKKEDSDHLKKACQIYAELDDPRLEDMLARYAKEDSMGAAVLADALKRHK